VVEAHHAILFAPSMRWLGSDAPGHGDRIRDTGTAEKAS
jgi:hypothetical protein